MNDGPGSIQRRKFLGLGLTGIAGASLPRLLPSPAAAASAKPTAAIVTAATTTQESTYGDRTDSFAEKIRLLNVAWEKKDFRLAQPLTVTRYYDPSYGVEYLDALDFQDQAIAGLALHVPFSPPNQYQVEKPQQGVLRIQFVPP